MFQIITALNQTKFIEKPLIGIDNIDYRGYNSNVFVTGEILHNLTNKICKPLKISSIADIYCPTRRDLYLEKSKNKLSNKWINAPTWERKVGYIVEKILVENFYENKNKSFKDYSMSIENSVDKMFAFIDVLDDTVDQLSILENLSKSVRENDTRNLLKLLRINLSAEIGYKMYHSVLKEKTSIDFDDILTDLTINPNDIMIGISKKNKPDFILPKYEIVGDIKTGKYFEIKHQLTCTGYALAYENEKKGKEKINCGIIYFFPTKNPRQYYKPLSFGQVYIFPIDDSLRRHFIFVRDRAYKIITNDNPPNFPDTKRYCIDCRYQKYCIEQGLDMEDEQ